VNRGFEEAPATFCFSSLERPPERQRVLVLPHERYQSFIDQCANGEVNGEDALLKLDELFKIGGLISDQTLQALRELAGS
jgi:hypothetical protein